MSSWVDITNHTSDAPKMHSYFKTLRKAQIDNIIPKKYLFLFRRQKIYYQNFPPSSSHANSEANY